MTSFASAFGSSSPDANSLNNGETNLNNSADSHQEESKNFSSIDLDQQSTPPSSSSQLQKQHSSYVSLTDAATFHTDSNVTTNNTARIPISSASQDFPSHYSTNTTIDTSSILSDKRISIPDMSKISASSAAAVAAVGPTIDKLKQWGLSTYKCTKQTLYEKLGKTIRTVDVELESQIEQLRETKRRYENVLALARSYANHFSNLLNTQRALSDTFLDLKHKSFHLCDEYGYNADTQNLLVRHGEILMGALNYFISTLDTLCNKTIEDTITTIRLYETSRLEYDACRTEMELLSPGSQLNEKQREFEKYKERYEKLKCDVSIKLKFLDENQTKVMKKELLLFHNAIAAYFSGNQAALEATMKQFNLKIVTNGDNNSQEKKSFLEQFHN
ncbi:unnamed protein product [Adineta steineri]|uniref:AH domain-containing protein n=1 Tax=Adineta steineri TaxID=433720 RepID=A0A814IBW8_9BILA|nr:unnamed protein product [Adineta steineri]CAF3737755.1 unnamed protein product [Adineta steineri]